MGTRIGEQMIDIRTTRILISLGVHVNSKGYNYMRRCIIETYYDGTVTASITKTLYPRVARLCGAEGEDVVARTCRRCVTNVLKKAPPSEWRKYFGIEPYRMSCGQFFSAIANYLHTECDGVLIGKSE